MAAWYERERTGLGSDFLDAMKERTQAACCGPAHTGHTFIAMSRTSHRTFMLTGRRARPSFGWSPYRLLQRLASHRVSSPPSNV